MTCQIVVKLIFSEGESVERKERTDGMLGQ